MEQINEFAKFHSLSPTLVENMRKYVSFSFAVTNGMNADAIASQLPPHLQLDVYVQLYSGMVNQVNIFQRCHADFVRAVVMKLQNSICTAGDYVFFEGESGERMYFIKYGKLQVLVNNVPVHTFDNGGYFGEIALLIDSPRTADIRAMTNCLLLSLASTDLDNIFQTFPEAQKQILEQSKERLAELRKSKAARKAQLEGNASHQDGLGSPSPAEGNGLVAAAVMKSTGDGALPSAGAASPAQLSRSQSVPAYDFFRKNQGRASLDSACVLVGPKTIGIIQRRIESEANTQGESMPCVEEAPSTAEVLACAPAMSTDSPSHSISGGDSATPLVESAEKNANRGHITVQLECEESSPASKASMPIVRKPRALRNSRDMVKKRVQRCMGSRDLDEPSVSPKSSYSIEGARRRQVEELGHRECVGVVDEDDEAESQRYALPIAPLSAPGRGGALSEQHSAMTEATVSRLVDAFEADRHERAKHDALMLKLTERNGLMLQELVSQVNGLGRQLNESQRSRNGW